MKDYPNVAITSYVKPTNIELRLTIIAGAHADIKATFDRVTKAILKKEQQILAGNGE